MKLLISVVDAVEALAAVEGGACIIDVKNPKEGSLGASFPRIIREVRRVTPSHIEVSATIGDLPNLPGTASLAALGAAVSGAQYIKAGLFGVKTIEEAIELLREICASVKDFNCEVKVIAAGYADFKRVGCINPLNLPEVAVKAGANGVMVDVKVKDGKKLFDFIGDEELKDFVKRAHDYGLCVALAGSLDVSDVARVFKIGADIIGVRGAVCSSRDRLRGVVQREAVAKFVKTISMCCNEAIL